MESTNIVQDLQNSAMKMTGWLKFVGIVTIVSGALAALSVIGIVFAWIPIWLGVLLMQAAARAENARISENPQELVQMFEKLRLLLSDQRCYDHSWSRIHTDGVAVSRDNFTDPDGKC